ncbi:extensin family protein [Sphingomonas nostoxanthinifaciens]|uniref:extensin family protein n=1 Tax=Sphingomonas nostoxanthinifaciens TaxID=2872652 RepID=UPI001CC21991|nr:extensin family protein [Sphingomonas nostoxanthinifaciens]UAK23599.1 extensin family protein [Sphingomonas nostoxanthinifaciens]
MAFLRFLASIALLAAVGMLAITALPLLRTGMSDRLDPGEAIGPLTGTRILALRGDRAACTAALNRAGVAYRALAERVAGDSCGFDDGVTWAAGGARTARYAPAAPPLACPLATALAMWEWDVVQPAAARLLGTTVSGVDHYGSYACRRIYGRAAGSWSEHARAEAIDVAGFRLADGRRITVARDWRGDDAAAAFLHAVRDGGCRLFATTLSPDYNAAHRNHLHLDEAARGGWRACR